MAGRKHLDFGAPSPTFSPHTASAPEPGLQQLGGSPLSRDAIRLGPAEVGSSEVAADATALGERAVPDHTAAPDVALLPVRTARHNDEPDKRRQLQPEHPPRPAGQEPSRQDRKSVV